jgi:hypothetical protein
LISSHPIEQFSNLPPSLNGGRLFQNGLIGSVFMQPLIKYSIRVVVGPKISNGHGIDSKPCSVTREVFIVPFCTKAPPVAVEDLPGEYRLLATKTLKQHLWSKGMG